MKVVIASIEEGWIVVEALDRVSTATLKTGEKVQYTIHKVGKGYIASDFECGARIGVGKTQKELRSRVKHKLSNTTHKTYLEAQEKIWGLMS